MNAQAEPGGAGSAEERHPYPYKTRYTVAGIALLLLIGCSLFVLTGGFTYITSRFSHPSGSNEYMNNSTASRSQAPDAYRNLHAPESNSRLLHEGKQIYDDHCLACHGENGAGEGPVSSGLNPKPKAFSSSYLQRVSDQYLFWRVSGGKPKTAMPAFKQVLSRKERWSVVHYIHTIARER